MRKGRNVNYPGAWVVEQSAAQTTGMIRMDTHGAKRISSWTTSKGKITKKLKIKLTLKFWTAISLQDGCRISDASKFGTPTSLASTSFSILGLGPQKKTTWDPKKNAAFPHCTSLGFDLALGREMAWKVEDPNAVFTCISSKFQGGPRGVYCELTSFTKLKMACTMGPLWPAKTHQDLAARNESAGHFPSAKWNSGID